MHNNVTICTAFFDIGRGEWTPDRGLPFYLHRTTDTYMERFGHLAKLNNDMIVFTSSDQKERIRNLRKDKDVGNTVIVSVDLGLFSAIRDDIQKIQKDPNYQKRINPNQAKNPEYWSPDYVLVNYLKSFFVVQAMKMLLVRQPMVAWVDFGYCREESTLNGVKEWSPNLNPDKIHLFNFREFDRAKNNIEDTIFNNTVYMFGAKIIGGIGVWEEFHHLMKDSFAMLKERNLMDDDQTLLLLSYLQKPGLFDLHRIDENKPFVLFKDFA